MQPKKERFIFNFDTRRSWSPLDLSSRREEERLFLWAQAFEDCAILHSNQYEFSGPPPHRFEIMVAAGAIASLPATPGYFDALERFHHTHSDWLFGHLAYDLKNDVEALHSRHADQVGFGDAHFFVPRHLFIKSGGQWYYGPAPSLDSAAEAQAVAEAITAIDKSPSETTAAGFSLALEPVETPAMYREALDAIINHLQRGDIYEVNYCTAFESSPINLNPFALFTTLNEESKSPYAAYYRRGTSHLMCFSPERFLTVHGDEVWSQPIKGTASRDTDPSALQNDPKEISENIMITDLVRNDLSRTAQPQSVEVLEKCGVYSFKHVHQLITTVHARKKLEVSAMEVIKNAFPMGSMTGAPKIRAMQIIDALEKRRRGLYSGSVGYFTPSGDCDFNVVIRSLQYSERSKILNLNVGGAITIRSDVQREYDEVLLKARAIRDYFMPATENPRAQEPLKS